MFLGNARITIRHIMQMFRRPPSRARFQVLVAIPFCVVLNAVGLLASLKCIPAEAIYFFTVEPVVVALSRGVHWALLEFAAAKLNVKDHR